MAVSPTAGLTLYLTIPALHVTVEAVYAEIVAKAQTAVGKEIEILRGE